MDDPMQASFGGDLEIEQRLDAYARVRLSPTERASARMRARVMREARLAMAAASTVSVTSSIDLARARRRDGLMRRGAGLLLAAGLSLAVAGGAMAAGQAGGPLYPTRMWLETITLPADGAARVDADLVRLESRMHEVIAAARKGDLGAVAAALLAYHEIADEALLSANGDAAAIERVRLALDRHLAVLEGVAAKVPPQASEAIGRNIDRAIERNGATLDRIESNKGGGGPATNPAPAAKPDRTPKPTATPAAAPTPARTQHPTPTPVATEPPKGPPDSKPDKTPPGHGRSQEP
jgi:cell division septation protein DedD